MAIERYSHVMHISSTVRPNLQFNEDRAFRNRSIPIIKVIFDIKPHHFLFYSQVTGELLDDVTCWDALRSTLPVGTVSGAPKVTFYFVFVPLSLPSLFFLTNIWYSLCP